MQDNVILAFVFAVMIISGVGLPLLLRFRSWKAFDEWWQHRKNSNNQHTPS